MTDPQAKFQKSYQRLNQNQRLAVDTIDGPVMVMAGPGTGKTMVLTTRIAKILEETDTKPHSILALTYTDSASAEMRHRLVDMIGSTGYYVRIETFHAFCSQVIQDNPEHFSIGRESVPLTDLEKYSLFESIILELKLELLSPLKTPLHYLGTCINQISNLKREGYLPEDFEKLLVSEAENLAEDTPELNKTDLKTRQTKLKKQQELLEVYKLYQERLTENHRYDFDDMIILVKEAFEQDEMLLRKYQEEIHYFLVDEYQDTNSAQNQIVDLLASYWEENANLFVVGDPHQSIFRFQGASMENMLGFIERYSKALIINLDVGYRCPQEIYDASHTLIQNNNFAKVDGSLMSALNQVLQSQKQNGTKIELYRAPSPIVQLMAVASKIKDLTDNGTNPEEIAVLYRANAESAELVRALEHFGIKYEIDSGNNILESHQIRQLLSLLRVVDQLKKGENPDQLFEILCFEWTNVSPQLALKIARASGKARLSLVDMILSGYEHFQKHHTAPAVSKEEFATLEVLLEQFFTWGIIDAQMTFPEWFEFFLEQSGYLAWILQSEFKTDNITELNSFYREIKLLAQSQPGLNLSAFISALDLMEQYKIKIIKDDLNIKTNAVCLTTTHKAKGQEWEHVFIINVQDKKWGNNAKNDKLPLPDGVLKHTLTDKREKNDEERRLFYVAITRAKKQVYISYPTTEVKGPKSKEIIGSMFLAEISKHLEETSRSEAEKIEKSSQDHLIQLLKPPEVLNIARVDEDYLRSLVENFSLSATALNKYLYDPSDFFLNSLLKVPRAKPEHMAFGTAIHGAFEFMFGKIMKEGKKPPIEKVWQVYEQFLRQELLISLDFERRLEYGKTVLEKYTDQLNLETVKPLYLERKFGYGASKTMLGDIVLNGRVDRIDWVDESKKTVRIIDYKTGNQQTLNQIQGKTQNPPQSTRERSLPPTIHGGYFRQLVFYKILSELDDSFIPTVTDVAFEFVEPDKKSGKTIRRNFQISDDAVADLKTTIKEVMVEIRGLQFLDYVPDALEKKNNFFGR